ncbi:hypothetical protein PC117_g6185 [Phytophthora cactorum]|uniref:S1-like domain-containing protein n=1 Tax=Phytophthora cactorum TaxID=29920 RepID=A0A8T1EAC9_9STRA|nr:hypothetical protein PC117_g6185 [Phytophthora cactorum]
MSGSGRKSAYRKGVTKRVLYGDPEPKENELIVRVTALRGSNLFEVVDAKGAKSVTMLPTKFRKLIWVKRGDFLIVGEGDGGEATTATGKKGAVTSIVEHILYKEQIKNLKHKELWPAAFDDSPAGPAWTQGDSVNEDGDQKGEEFDAADKEEAHPPTASSSKGLTMAEDRFAMMHVNRNRRKGHFDEEEEEDSDDELSKNVLWLETSNCGRRRKLKHLGIMQRKRSNVYNVGPAVSHYRPLFSGNNTDPETGDLHVGVVGKYSEKNSFSDLRVEIDRELASKYGTHPGYLRSKSSIMRSSGVTKTMAKAKSVAANAHESALLAPSKTRQMQRRSSSASAVRKKLFHAVEQGSNSGHQHQSHKLQAQIDALRNLASASFSKTHTKIVKGYYTSNADTSSTSQGIVSLARRNSGVLAPTHKPQNQEECVSGVGIGPNRSASASILMSNPAQPVTNSNAPYPAPSVLVGGYRSSSVQLEVELVERLNEIGRSNLPEKTLSRTRACQNVLDSVVLQDEHYGRLLSRIRDEFSTYVDMTSRKSPIKSSKSKGAKPWCACEQDIFEFALIKQENTVMKKRVSSMQHEIESLQAALRQARAGDSSGHSNQSSVRDTWSTDCWPEDDPQQGDDLDDVQLFPAEVMNRQHSRPHGVPMLSFATLPSYSDEEEDDVNSQ